MTSAVAHARGLAALASVMAPELRDGVVARALELIAATADPDMRVATLATLGASVPPALTDAALEIATRTRGVAAKARAVECIASKLDTEQLDQLLSGALTGRSAHARARTISAIAKWLPTELHEKAITKAAAIEDPNFRVEALADLAAELPGAAVAKALPAVMAIPDAQLKARAIAHVAPRLTPVDAAHAFAQITADTVLAGATRAQALAAIAPTLADDQRSLAVDAAVTAAVAVMLDVSNGKAADVERPGYAGETRPAGEYSVADTIVTLAPHLSSRLAEPALMVVANTTEPHAQLRGINALAKVLPDELMPRLLELAQATPLPAFRGSALAAIAPRLAPSELEHIARTTEENANLVSRQLVIAEIAPYIADDLVARALVAALTAPDDHIHGDLPGRLARELPPEVLSTTVGTVAATPDPANRARWLAALAAVARTPERLAEARDAARETDDPWARGVALARLVPHLSGDDQREAVADVLAAAEASAETGRAEIIGRVVTWLDGDQRSQALRLAARTEDSAWRANILVELAPKLDEAQLADALAAAIDNTGPYSGFVQAAVVGERSPIGGGTSSGEGQADALVAVAPYLTASMLREAWRAAGQIESASSRARALSALAVAPQLVEDGRAAALQAALAAAAAADDAHRVRALATLAAAPDLDDERRTAALIDARETAAAIPAGHGNASALASLIPLLPERLLSNALNAAAGTVQSENRSEVLIALAPVLPAELLSDAFSAANDMPEYHARAAALEAVALRADEMPRATLHALAAQAMQRAASEGEHALLTVLDALAPAHARLGGEDVPAPTRSSKSLDTSA